MLPEDFFPFVWECACGGGHLSEVLKTRGYDVKSSDIIDRGYENIVEKLCSVGAKIKRIES